MKSLFSAHTLMFCCLLALCVHAQDGNFHSHGVDASPWESELETFQKLLETEPEAARAELQSFAKKVFDEHPLTEEWVPLYFRIRKNGTKYPSDLKRVSELEIRILKSLDAEKYAKQIQHHQEAIERYAAFSDRRTPVEESPATTQGGVSGRFITDPSEDTRHSLKSFFELLPKDPKAARAALDKFAALTYQNHPLIEEWTKLFFRHYQAKKATILESIRVKELQKQMLTDIDAEKHAEVIKDLERLIKYQKRLQKTFERQGQPNAEIEIEVTIEKE